MNLPGKKVRRTRWVRTDRYVVAVDVDAIILDADPSEPVYGPEVGLLLKQVEDHAKAGEVDWLRRYGKVYAAVEAA